MKMRLADLWTWHGTMDRLPYALWGAFLVLVKYNVDRAIMRLAFDRPWTPAHYFSPIVPVEGALESGGFAFESLVLLAAALPFLWTGIGLTLRRLRAAGLPRALVVLFVLPWIKWLLFLLLVLAPNSAHTASLPHPAAARTLRDPAVARRRRAAALFAITICASLGVILVWLGLSVRNNYGWSLFAGVPFTIGFVAALLAGWDEPNGVRRCIIVALATVFTAGLAVLLVGFEGLICLLMAAPVMAPMAAIGGLAGYFVLRTKTRWDVARFGGGAMAAVPLLLVIETSQPATAPLLEVSTAIDINAPPEIVWRHVTAFSELPPPKEWIFRLGIAYPMRARIEGAGIGAVRHCEFSTGAFVEPIEVWDEPSLLQFSVTENPAPMQEWTFYDEIHPPHLDDFLASERGQFRLIALGDGRTRVIGTTWYRHHMEPARYWQLWSDAVIHRIHHRVLAHVKQLAEGDSAAPAATPTPPVS